MIGTDIYTSNNTNVQRLQCFADAPARGNDMVSTRSELAA
jgi:hypothetical protein